MSLMAAEVPGVPESMTIPAVPAQVRAARAFVARVLGAPGPGADTVLVLASELATNSVRHSGSAVPGGVVTVRSRRRSTLYTMPNVLTALPKSVAVRQISPPLVSGIIASASTTSSGGGGTYVGPSQTQCQSLASEQSSITQQVDSLSATYTNQINSLTSERNTLIAQNTQLCNSLTAQGINCDTNAQFIANGQKIANLYYEIQNLQKELASNTQIASLKQQAVAIGQQMSSLGCFG